MSRIGPIYRGAKFLRGQGDRWWFTGASTMIAEANFTSGAEEASRTEERPGGCQADPAQFVIERGGETALVRCIVQGVVCHKA